MWHEAISADNHTFSVVFDILKTLYAKIIRNIVLKWLSDYEHFGLYCAYEEKCNIDIIPTTTINNQLTWCEVKRAL